MADLKLTLTCADYARVMPLVTGAVKPKGIDLTLEVGQGGSWPMRAEMLRRAIHDPDVHGGEGSVCVHLLRMDKGDRSLVGLPVFPLRNFTARDLYVRKDGPIRSAADLQGCRIGMYGWANSGAVWYRHFLKYIGVDLTALHWWIGPIDAPRPTTSSFVLPSHVKEPEPGVSIAQMLEAGALDAIYSPNRPLRYHAEDGPIVRLFPHFRGIEQDYFRATKAFPPQHLMLLRRAVWEENPWIAQSLTEAFIACNDMFTAAQRNFPYASPWLEAELDETTALMGADFHPYGYQANAAQIQMFADQAFESQLTTRRVMVEEYFAEYLQGS
jgi:4,5-dihydroxyphthalate decarboxylase